MREYILNFADEVEAVVESGKFPDFINVIASYIAKHHPALTKYSNKIARELIIEPMFRRMRSKHEILWKNRYSLAFDFSKSR